MAALRFKRVMRLDRPGRCFRLFRAMWERGKVGDGEGYSAKLAVAFEPRLLRWETSYRVREPRNDWRVTLLGVRLHYARSYGGRFV